MEFDKGNVEKFRNETLELGYSFFKSKVLLTATKLDIFNIIGEMGLSVNDVAAKLNSDEDATEIFLDAIVSLNLLKKKHNQYFNTENGKEIFIYGKEMYLGDIIVLQDVMWDAWSRLEESIVTGRPARKPDMFQDDKEETRNFIMAMHNTAITTAHILSREIDLSDCKTLIDIGGGPGTYSVFFCKENCNLEVTILDLPGTLEITRELISNSNVTHRTKLIEGDFNKEIEGRYDAAFLSNIIHGEGEKENIALIKRVYNALNDGGKIIIKDFFLDDNKASPAFPALFSLNMLLFTENGRSYSLQEIKGWLEKAGFRGLTRMNIKLPRSASVLIGKK
ncbi:MAG: tetracenomycin polyketide synthesis 8-O-methyltransferase [Candidatus Scalindua rubra]|uniref:Tetracenomycin polyketide synthesis 8-O-methyltransferase n=1 Tax=Candidatus Scalindua rubra TaxID=1872076 RepID=A0A1E3X7R3_9BACT|nr:MAG: tetracenomycin polyketide synthesis 8-O-methyltransferase [Candidatus Scalindua rubra]